MSELLTDLAEAFCGDQRGHMSGWLYGVHGESVICCAYICRQVKPEDHNRSWTHKFGTLEESVLEMKLMVSSA